MILKRRRSTIIWIVLAVSLCTIYMFAYSTIGALWEDLENNVSKDRILLSYEDDIFFLLNKSADDPELVKYVKSHFVVPPSDKVYNLTQGDQIDFSRGQSKLLDSYFNKKENGVFLDVGSYDGEFHSVSLFFEKSRKWKGVLVENNPVVFRRLQWKNRKAHTINGCARSLNIYTNGSKKPDGDIGAAFVLPELNVIIAIDTPVNRTVGQTTPYANNKCFWVETILLASGYSQVDLLNIDTHDNEINVLRSIPLEKFKVKAISLELDRLRARNHDVVAYLKNRGYKYIHQFEDHLYKKIDQIYIKL